MKFESVAGLTGRYRITLDGEEPVIITVIAADIMRWEQVNSKSFFAGDVSLTRMAWVAWAACKRLKHTDLDVADFLARVEDVEKEDLGDGGDDVDEEDEEAVELPDPTAEEFTG